jgi:hypothetical protein
MLSRENLAWLIFALGTLFVIAFILWMRPKMHYRKRHGLSIRACICRVGDEGSLRNTGRSTGGGFLMLWGLVAVVPALLVGDTGEVANGLSEFEPSMIPWYGWLMLLIIAFLVISSIVKIVRSRHSPICKLRRILLGLLWFTYERY